LSGAVIDPRAVVHEGARLGSDVVVGPFCVIGPEVAIGDRTRLGSHVVIDGRVSLGPDNAISPFVSLGGPPQDLKYAGEPTEVTIGARNRICEYVTVSRGTKGGGGITRIGDDNLFMAYAHIAHDAVVGSRIVFANAATLAGHVTVGDDATIGAFSAVHQHCRVGRHAYIGGFSVVTQDALPFAKTVGHKPACYGLNRIGLERKGFGPETLRRLEAALRLLTRRRLSLPAAVAAMRAAAAEWDGEPAVEELIAFVAGTERGVIVAPPGSGRSRGSAAIPS
jgi:UDP-N-acetylglucosamine acyltransferase